MKRFTKGLLLLSALAVSFGSEYPLLPSAKPFALAQSLDTLPQFKLGSRTLELGMAGTDVAELQQRLQQFGYFDGNLTGIFDLATQASVIQFQRDQGFNADGKAGTQTQTALLEFEDRENLWPVNRLVGLRQDAIGVDVQKLQLLLQNSGFPPGKIDGRFGTDTESSLIAFQQFYGLSATGIVDEQTATRLVRVNTVVPEQPWFPDIETQNLYVVVIPEGNDESLLQSVRWLFPDASRVETDRRGPYIEIGQFLDRELAEKRSNNARDQGFDARVVYFRNQSILAVEEPSVDQGSPSWRPPPFPF